MSTKHRKDKLFYFLENWLISVVLSLLTIILLLNHILLISEVNIAFDSLEKFLQEEIRPAVDNMQSSLLTIAAIFIGIYVTVFTLLGSIKVDSVFAYLNENTFKKLIIFIRNAFIASFGYLVIVLLFEVLYTKGEVVPIYFIIVNSIIVLYMFATAFRFGIILYISFNKDLKNLQQNIEAHRREHREIKELQHKVSNFLEDYETKKNAENAEELSKKLEDKQNERDKHK